MLPEFSELVIGKISDSEMSLKGSRNIEKYLEFLDLWYDEHCDDLTDEELNTFKIKV